MRDNLELVARPKGVLETLMDKGLVCRTPRELDEDCSEAPPQLANQEASGFVYFIRAGRTNNLKIGWAKNDVEKRISELQCGCPHKLNLIAYVPGSLLDEWKWHQRFKKARVRGEWFTLTFDLRCAINSLCQAHSGAVSYILLSVLGRNAIGSPFDKNGERIA